MPRRRRTSEAEDIVRTVALLPWWACVLVALLSYLVLHGVANAPAAPVTDPKQLGSALTRTILSSLAAFGQYVVPLLCLAAAVLSAANRSRRTALIGSVTSARSADALERMTWREFELLIGEAFRLQGYEVTELGGTGPNGGVDLVLRRDREVFLVQCKQWKAFKVGVQVVRELYGVMAARGAAGGFVVTSGTFTSEAIAFANGLNVRQVDGPKLFGLIQKAKAAGSPGDRPAPTQAAEAPLRLPAKPQAEVAALPITPFAAKSARSGGVVCPSCSKTMVKRVAKRGEHAGRAFWGCTGYPVCRGTRPLGMAVS